MGAMRILTDVAHRPAQVLTGVVRLFLGLALFSTPVFAQSLTVEPACGVAGSSVKIGGSGWAEPVPICDYHFLFDGATFAPKQLDGLFGPPNRTATVPGGATPGDHKIKVELRLTSGNTLLQCRQTNFKVVSSANADPWASGNTTNGSSTDIKFNPTDVCDVTPCSKIVFIQIKQPLGELTASPGTTRKLTHAEQTFPNAADLDPDLTPAGFSVDYLKGEADPYYNGDDAPDGAEGGTNPSQGTQSATSKVSTMHDAPGRDDGAYPADISKIILNFEVNAFCAEGQNRGEYLGKLTWKWERLKGGTGTSTILSKNRTAPSQSFLDAVSRWNNNHGFPFPISAPVFSPGEACQ